MIENFKIEINDKEKIKKIKKSNLIVRLSILGAFLLTVLISAIVVFSGGKMNVVSLGYSSGSRYIDYAQYTYQEIKFTNLKDDGSTETIHASDFKAKYYGVEYVGQFISTGTLSTSNTEYELVHNGSDKYIAVYFKMYQYSDTKYYYNGELLEYNMNNDGRGLEFLEVVIIEFIIFGVIFAFVTSKLSARLYPKNGEKYRAVNEKIDAKLKDMGFKTTKTFALSGRKSGLEDIEKMLIFVDGKNKKFAFVDYDKLICKVVDYKDLINYKVIEKNGTDVNSHLRYSIILDSAYTTTSSREVCKKLQLVFVLNDEEDSTIIYELVKSSIAIDSTRYKKLSKEMIELTAFLDIVEKNTPKDKKFIYCKHCGVKNNYEDKHCSACGSALD